MKTIYLLSIGLFLNLTIAQAQNALTYKNEKGDQHLAGPVTIADFKSDTTYANWYNESYESFELQDKKTKWSKNLKDTEVNIYMGTWCGDSQEWVPQFIKLWEALGLNKDQIKITALYDTDEQYKQGPNGEEKGLNIHRVPTFIFKKDGNEYARIVESPSTDLVTDVAQIALGYPSSPNYAAANYLLDLFDQKTIEEIYNNYQDIFYRTYGKVGKYNELNTLGNVLLAADQKKQALVVFQLNTYFFAGNWYTHYKLGETYEKIEENEAALKSYEKAISIKEDHTESLEAIERLKKLVPEASPTEENTSEEE